MKRNPDGTFAIGNKGGGRAKGKKNRSTQDLRNFFHDFLMQKVDTLNEAFEELEPREKFKVLLDMSRYVIPTLKAQGDILEELTDEQFDELIERVKAENEQEIKINNYN